MSGAGAWTARLLVWALFGARLSAQQGGEITGISALSAGRAGTSGAAADSVLDSARNPATLAFLFGDGPRQPHAGTLEATGRLFYATVEGRDASGEPFAADPAFGGGLWLGYAAALSDRSFLGVTLTPTLAGGVTMDRDTELQVGTPTRMREIEIDNHVLQVALQPVFAWRLDESFSVGVGASLRHTRVGLQSAAEFDIVETFQGDSPFGNTWGEFLSDDPFNIDTMQAEYNGDAEGVLAADAHLGLLWEPARNWRVGAWYRSPSTRTDLEGGVDINLEPELGPILDFYGLNGRSHYDVTVEDVRFPQQLGLGLSHAPSARDRLHLDATWTEWSDTFSGWPVLLSGPSNDDFRELVGGNGDTSFDLDLRWHDVYTLSLGYERDLARDLTVRGGLGWQSDPTAGSIGPGSHAFNTWHATLGLSLWGENGGDWHFALVAALPDSVQGGVNQSLSDFSFDTYRTAIYSLAVQYVLSW